MMKRAIAAVSIALLTVGSVGTTYAAPAISHAAINCVPAGGNAKIFANVADAASARVYFRAFDGAEYYVEMLRQGDGSFWAMLPIPEANTSSVTYRIVARGNDGIESSTSSMTVPVSANCASPSLTDEERRLARNLVIGQTLTEVSKLRGFECEGVVNTVTVDGEMRAYNECEPTGAMLATTAPGQLTVGQNIAIGATAVAVAVAGVVLYTNNDDDDEAVSPILP